MNLSERIRSCLSSPKAAADVHSTIGGDLSLIRGCIQTMVKVGLLERIGDAKPYCYQVARQLNHKMRGKNRMAVSKAQQIRDWLKKNGKATNAEISNGVALKPKISSKTLCDMRKRGYVIRSEDGYFSFVSDPEPVKRLTPEERREANRIKNSRRSSRAYRKRKKDRITAYIKKDSDNSINSKTLQVKAQSVDEWLKEGNKIDRSPTPTRFERLTHEDIVSGARRGFGGYQTPQTRRFSQYG